MRIYRAGDRALLVDFDNTKDVARHHAGWATGHAGIAELVPAATTVLAMLTDDADPEAVARWLRSTPPADPSDTSGDLVTLDVVYDGPDLEAVRDATGRDVVADHTGSVWTAAFCGFSPGFAYLVSDLALDVPRRRDPRTSVPAGSVALAGNYSAVYPSSSPGGWQLIGRTDAALWSVDRDPPALIVPGTRVQFRQVG
ncbi:5-oxoprolinase subunit B family protein [Rhodococcoides corynebacterioides]|uniref:Allophanate hydrolase subunit 1 n=1 Tax=Rhodococcoides corynebacterioides TaxID=53972 RepID=A0ABS7PA38_9NOCA|nr:allophanate hydrolase subunit 1 [Rhodococcus corynebacterioides]MBY6368707.1 allophanate hydrolase subunit 1 [Rhodococcus corynebacterioides]MBY6409746.1 allophanate hydrolase subunit 1 [Rhodococcus corynebacterioides]